jgi:hypothetical protein
VPRRDHRDDRRGDGHIGELCTGGLTLEQVADNGQSDRHARAGAGALHDTPHRRVGSERASAQPIPAMMKSIHANATTGFRPYRSEAGP